MTNFWINMLVMVTRKLLDKALWEEVSKRVEQANHLTEKTGDEKRNWVVAQIHWGSSWLVNLAIEVVVASMKVKENE